MSKVQDIKKSSLTFAPEAGSQRLRDVINKGLTKDVILQGAGMAFEGGWNKVKLYFMLGLPTETEEDMRAIPELANDIAVRYYEIPKDQRNGKCQITISTSFFVPKPFTPFQWARMYQPEDYIGRAKIVNDTVKEQLNRKSIKYNWHEADVTVLEGEKLLKSSKKLTVWDVCMTPGAISLIMTNGCRHLKIRALISHSIISGKGLWMRCSHGILSIPGLPKSF